MPRGGVWVSGRQGCPASGQEDMLAVEAPPLSLIPPSSVAGWDAGHLLGCRHQPPGRDMPWRGSRGKFRSGSIKSSTPEAELLQTESNPRVARALGEQLLPPRSHLPAEGVPRTRKPQQPALLKAKQVSSDGSWREVPLGEGPGTAV